MEKITNLLNENGVLVIIGIIVVIVFLLFIILLIERKNKLKYNKEYTLQENLEDYDGDIEDNNNISLDKNKDNKHLEDILKIKELENIEKTDKVDKVDKNVPAEEEHIIYKEEETPKEAKKAIEEAAKKLVYEEQSDIVTPTFFEKMQEENSIISYDELMSKNLDFDLSNEQVLEDDGNEPITIDELYKFHEKDDKEDTDLDKLDVSKDEKSYKINAIDEDSVIDSFKDSSKDDDEKMVYYVNSESKKFKNSQVISPVFGVKRDVIYKKEYNELGETIDIKELDMEIKKTEEFLKQLKRLKDKLD
mgnify:FL=1